VLLTLVGRRTLPYFTPDAVARKVTVSLVRTKTMPEFYIAHIDDLRRYAILGRIRWRGKLLSAQQIANNMEFLEDKIGDPDLTVKLCDDEISNLVRPIVKQMRSKLRRRLDL
jgi:hypothetical protein